MRIRPSFSKRKPGSEAGRFRIAIVFLTVVILSVVVVQSPVEASESEHENWYGWQLMISDAVACSAVASGLYLNEPGLGWIGIGTYFLAAPSIHTINGDLPVATQSLALRVVVPGAFALGYGVVKGTLREGGQGGAVAFAVGAGVAMLIDWFLLANISERHNLQQQSQGIVNFQMRF